MHVDVLDENDFATAESAPTLLNPFPFDVAVEQNMQVRNAAFVKFQDRDVRDRALKLPAQVEPKFVEDSAKIADRVTLDLRGVQC